MKYLLSVLTGLTLLILISCSKPKKENEKLGKEHAKSELYAALKNLQSPNAVDNSRIILKDSITAINVAEPILFSIYGKESIISQQPYESYFIDKYWVIFGTLPEDHDGGVFLIIIDATNSRILKISHGK